jgi:cell division protein ZapE
MNAAWLRLTGTPYGEPKTLIVLGRRLRVPQAAKGVARFSFDDLCHQPLAAVDYLEIARHFHTLLIDNVPVLSPAERNEARRFILLIDTLYDEHMKLICSGAAPDALPFWRRRRSLPPDDLAPRRDAKRGLSAARPRRSQNPG